MVVDTLTEQHVALLKLAGDLGNLLDPDALATNAGPAIDALGKLASTLAAHLKLEDEQLYPSLLESDDPEVKGRAQQYVEEMSGIGAAFQAYVEKWTMEGSIAKDADGFISQTGEIFAVLSQRIEREESGLFVLLKR